MVEYCKVQNAQSHVCLITDVKMMLMKKTVKDVNDDNAKHDNDSRMMPRKLMQKGPGLLRSSKPFIVRVLRGNIIKTTLTIYSPASAGLMKLVLVDSSRA